MADYTAAGLVNPTNLRASLIALRSEMDRFDAPTSPDPELVDPVDQPFETVDGTVDRLQRLETRLRERGDRRAVFLTVYAHMTRAVRAGIDGDRFTDPEWMRAYLLAFANYYRRAFLAFERDDLGAVPDPWRVAFGTAIDGDTLVVQDAFLGINAHINYDLALAVADAGIDPDRDRKYADHRAIDGILGRILDAQQAALAEVYAAGIADLDAAFGRLDESVTLRSMVEAREHAWRVAVVLTDVGVAPIAVAARWLLRTTATGGAFFVLKSGLDPAARRAMRDVETRGVDLRDVLDRLDAHLEKSV